jgi:hypothetical protein
MSTFTIKLTKASALAQLQALISGLQKHYPNGQFTFGNVAYTTVSLVTLFQGLIDAINKVNVAQASAKDVVSAMNAMEATVGPVFLLLRRNLRDTYGTTSQTLLDFGLTPAKARAPMTAEQKAAAQAKAKATRIARGTASKKAKNAIKGNVSGVTVTPNTVVPAPASPAQPVTAPSTGK